jgi:hypothetical protein
MDILLHKLHVILQRGLVEIRNLSLCQAHQQIGDLADTLEILPSLMARWEDSYLKVVREALTAYQAKYADKAYDHLSILDMDEASFQDVFAKPEHGWELNNDKIPMDGARAVA